MDAAWKKIEAMCQTGVVHNRKHFKLKEVRPLFIMGQLLGEIQELAEAPDDPYEAADVLGVLFHYCIKQGWSMEDIEAKIIEKLDLRFSMPSGGV